MNLAPIIFYFQRNEFLVRAKIPLPLKGTSQEYTNVTLAATTIIDVVQIITLYQDITYFRTHEAKDEHEGKVLKHFSQDLCLDTTSEKFF